MKRAALYVRVSTEEQKLNGLSIDNQIDALTEYCKKNEYAIVDIYNDAGISARKRYKKRPELLRLINDCACSQIDVILFTRLDRWFRSVKDYYEVQALLDECNVKWRAIWEDYETETSSGILKVNIMLSVAQAEADRTSEKIKSVIEYKKSQGEYVGTVPPGYIRVNKKLVKDPELEEAIHAVFYGYMVYKPLRDIMEEAKALGFNANKAKIQRILSNPVYVGRTKGGIEGVDPYISQEEWDVIQQRRKQYTRSTKKRQVYLFNGIVRCGVCGKAYASKTSSGTREGYVSLRCRARINDFKCASKGISENKLERYVLQHIDNVFKDEHEKYKVTMESKDKKSTEGEKKKLEGKLKRIIQLYEDGDISREDYVRKRNDINERIHDLSKEPQKEPPVLPDNWREIYDEMSKSGKSEFWHRIIEKIIIDSKDGNHTIILRNF